MNSSVLLVGAPLDWRDDLGAEKTPSTSLACDRIRSQSYACIAIFTASQPPQQVLTLLELLHSQTAPPETVLVVKSDADDWLGRWLVTHRPVRVVRAENLQDLPTALQVAVERHHLHSQERDRLRLMEEQNQRLRHLNQELERRVEKRQKSLLRAKEKLLVTNRQIEVLQGVTLAIHKARSIGELENSLTEALRSHLAVSATRIRFRSQSTLTASLPPHTLHQTLTLNGLALGELLILGLPTSDLNESDQALLEQIGEAVALGVDRLAKLEEAEVLKHQWQTTFDSISEPLCLTDSQFRILRTNRAFAEAVGKPYRELTGRNCFAEFFDPSEVQDFFALGATFKVRRHRWEGHHAQSFEVNVQPLHFDSPDGEVVLVLFRDITTRLQLERQLLESSKLAELGLIGSSIAHELNNPLGGMLSFIQLVRMDLKENETLVSDIQEMESAALRCRDIVQNLLGFARRGSSSDRKLCDLKDVLNQALRITELQTRSLGIEMKTQLCADALPLLAQSNQLSQAFCNLMQNSTEAILEKRRADPRAPGQIEVHLHDQGQTYLLEIRDTGTGIAPEVQDKIFNPLFTTKGSPLNSGLGLTIAYRIIVEHRGRLEITSQPGVGTTARISFQRPDLPMSSQVFDPKI